ncbi:acyl-ACP--UDP-N-acetylglucosamine O-acyltransferase [Candidatus Bandiella numerosa]|uniref:acyl-ACP--UDP-N-acetylglucosamine O-acyltransferase n=1 Tax=Candidatus Bandiella numerosa TaxID=2570586 RepID=UPI00249ED830|nr:acyl-ACP--UDP-N-acetylglucosamine O-acyltransferase [Candidatus Bandiella numerosa]WHA04355.1 acyl-ACP--UDP-N-acetylglucosamine O-acyltransferase [Candidatus Bandiella numerosa]
MIHKTAIIQKGAQIHSEAIIGPYCTIGRNVELAKGVKLHSHVCIDGFSYIGENTEIFPFASIGYPPQDLKYNGEESRVIIGKNNIIREYSTINTGTKHGNMETVIGDNCLLMISSHIAHDCVVGDNVILANNATLGGHVILGNNVIIGGLAAVHQFVRIGKFAIVGGVSAVVENVAPFASVAGDRAKIVGINIVGMKRHNYSKDAINSIKNIFKVIFGKDINKGFDERIKIIKNNYDNDESREIVKFLEEDGKRGFCMPSHKWELND